MAEHQQNNIFAWVDGVNHNDEVSYRNVVWCSSVKLQQNSNIEDDVEIGNESDQSSSSDTVFDAAQQSQFSIP